jgi:hypothetical protein
VRTQPPRVQELARTSTPGGAGVRTPIADFTQRADVHAGAGPRPGVPSGLPAAHSMCAHQLARSTGPPRAGNVGWPMGGMRELIMIGGRRWQ